MADYSSVQVQLTYSKKSDYIPDLISSDETIAHEQRPDGRYSIDVLLNGTTTENIDLSQYDLINYIFIQAFHTSGSVDVEWEDRDVGTNSNLMTLQANGGMCLLTNLDPSVTLDLTGPSSGTNVPVKVIVIGNLAV